MPVPLLMEVQYTLDAEGAITEISENVESLVGYTREDCLGRPFRDLVHPSHRHLVHSVFLSFSSGDNQSESGMTLALVDREGTAVYTWLRSEAAFDREGRIHEVRGLIRDMTVPRHRERAIEQACKKLDTELRRADAKDILTGVYNRLHLEDKIANLDTKRYRPVSIIVCDIDGLRQVNDTLGFAAGNQVLITTAALIRNTLRDSDFVARTGSSEFAVVLVKTGEDGLPHAVERMRKAIAQYNNTPSHPHLNLTLGTATGEDPDQGLLEVYKQAENAMYRKKLHSSRSVRNSVVQVLLTALAERDFMTEAHADRIRHFAMLLGTAVGLSELELVDLQLLAQFHDIGKLAVPDSILLKPGPLTVEERLNMNRHPEIGHRIALSSPDLTPIADQILTHHEWWNGKGYPRGLNKLEIPLQCRILAIVDAYDAMTSNRPYRKAMHHRDAVQELVRCSGTQFDPQLVKTFIELMDNSKGLYVCQS